MTIQDLTFRLIHRGAGKDHVNADFLSMCALNGDYDGTGARDDYCSKKAAVSATAWDGPTGTFQTQSSDLDYNQRAADRELRDLLMKEDPWNPATEYMGLNRLPDEEANVLAIIKGTHEQVCTRYATATAITKPQVAQCYQTKAMTSYRESPRSDMFEDS